MTLLIKKLFFLAVVFLSCANQNQQNNSNMNILKVKTKVTFSAVIGYGKVYKGEVLEVIEGDLNQEVIAITILSSDKTYGEKFYNYKMPALLEISFEQEAENVKYSLMPITGMVDNNKTSWKMIDVKVVED